jgi:hypothetical protein
MHLDGASRQVIDTKPLAYPLTLVAASRAATYAELVNNQTPVAEVAASQEWFTTLAH